MTVFRISPTVPIDQLHAFLWRIKLRDTLYSLSDSVNNICRENSPRVGPTNERVHPIHPCPFHPPSACVIRLMVHDHPYPHTHVQGAPFPENDKLQKTSSLTRNQRGRVTQGRKEEKSSLKIIRGGDYDFPCRSSRVSDSARGIWGVRIPCSKPRSSGSSMPPPPLRSGWRLKFPDARI